MTAMIQTFRMTTSATAQAAFIGTGFMAFDGAAQVLSGKPNSGQPLPNEQPRPLADMPRVAPASSVGGLSGPRFRFSTVRSGWLDSKPLADGDCQSHGLRLQASYPRLSQRQSRATTATATAH
jgi:hypothetical protein